MFNNVVLDVFIGLVLIYLLYSLLVTVLSEIVVSWLGLRSRVLRVSLEKMLNDGYFGDDNTQAYQGFWFIIQRFFLKEFPAFRHSFAGVFYSYPSIKYLAQRAGEQKTAFTETKPSYITDDNFADTLIQMLKDKGSGATDMDKILFCLQFNTYQVQPATLKRLRDLAENAGKDISIFKNNLKSWYNETQDRTSGWYKRKLQLILFWLGFIVAVIFNVDSLRIAKILSKDENAREQLVKMGIELSKDSARYKEFLQNNDTELPQAVLDSGYNRITKDISEANMVLGLSWGTDKLFKNLECEVEPDEKAYAVIARDTNNFSTAKTQINDFRAAFRLDSDSLKKALTDLKKSMIDSLRTGDTLITNVLAANRRSVALYKNKLSRDSMLIMHGLESLQQVTDNTNNSLDGEFASIDSVKVLKTELVVYGKRHYYWYEKTWHVLKNTFTGYRFVGFFITGLMLSLGAPFWFDLLKKLVSIRGDGVKPEEKKVKNTEIKFNEDATSTPRPSAPITTSPGVIGDVIEEGLKLYSDAIRKVPGVKAVFSVIDVFTRERIIQVNVGDEETKAAVLSKFPILRVAGLIAKHKVIVSGIPVTHIGPLGTISNLSGNNGSGSLGCQLQRKDTKTFHILSCWHVMKGDRHYSFDDNDTTILDHNERFLGQRWAGGIFREFDYAIAKCSQNHSENFNTTLRSKLDIQGAIHSRHIDRQDIEQHKAVKYFDSLTNQVRTGVIYTDSEEVIVNYLDKSRVVKDVLIVTHVDQAQGTLNTISAPGNSGSLIFDEKGRAIAMIISGDFNFTYAIKLQHILDIHKEMQFA